MVKIGTSSERKPLIRSAEEWLKHARQSDCAKNIDTILKDKKPEEVDRLKEEMFRQIYDTMGSEIAGKDLIRALVVKNEKFGVKTLCFLNVITLGLFCCFRPRDDDIVLVSTRDGHVTKLKVARPACCPRTGSEVLFVILKYMILLALIVVLPMLVHILVMNKSVEEELHDLHLDEEGFRDLPAFLRRNYIVCFVTVVVFLLWICSLLPHDYRDQQRRRHMAREVSAGQFSLYGCVCCRRSRMRLFFGTYPSQTMLDAAGTLGLGRSVGPVPPDHLNTVGPSPSTLLTVCTMLLTAVTTLDTGFAWLDRSIALGHLHTMQKFCLQAPADEAQCTLASCQAFVKDQHTITDSFCGKVHLFTDPSSRSDRAACAQYGNVPPCCGGCTLGGAASFTDEGSLATTKAVVSIIADIGTLAFVFLATKYALSLAHVTDNIDVLIKRRSRTRFQTELANFSLTLPLVMDFVDSVFGRAGISKHAAAADGFTQTLDKKWQGVQNFQRDTKLREWDDFFKQDLLSPPETRWTSKLKVPAHCLGIGDSEKVLAAWFEMPLVPPSMTLWEFLLGGLWYILLPFGKTQHAVIVTDRRVFYMTHRRPSLPIPQILQTDLRVDIFRHDHDVFYGRMERTKVPSLQRLVHQFLLLEWWLPGKVFMQNNFGVLQLNRAHGDILDVYHVVSQLARVSTQFISKEAVTATGLNWDTCKDTVRKSMMNKKGNMWSISPQSDDAVEPTPEILLTGNEELVYTLNVTDISSVWSPYYTNTDVIVTTGRLFLWSRKCYKNFDCQMGAYWCCCWAAFLNPLFAAKHLGNVLEFVSMPALLSFSTDMNVEQPLWHVPHHTPLKCPCFETCCAVLTRMVTRDKRKIDFNLRTLSPIPKRSMPITQLQLTWRLKQSAHAETDMLIPHAIKPYFLKDMPDEEIQDLYSNMGFSDDRDKLAQQCEDNEKIEALRMIMCVVQDRAHSLLDDIDNIAFRV